MAGAENSWLHLSCAVIGSARNKAVEPLSVHSGTPTPTPTRTASATHTPTATVRAKANPCPRATGRRSATCSFEQAIRSRILMEEQVK